jgi:hypothetical protein
VLLRNVVCLCILLSVMRGKLYVEIPANESRLNNRPKIIVSIKQEQSFAKMVA